MGKVVIIENVYLNVNIWLYVQGTRGIKKRRK